MCIGMILAGNILAMIVEFFQKSGVSMNNIAFDEKRGNNLTPKPFADMLRFSLQIQTLAGIIKNALL